MGGEGSGELPAPASQHLQPQSTRHSEPSAEATALEALHQAEFSADERDAADAAAERMTRLLRDQQLVAQLAATGFAGTAYEVFKAGLASYGYPVIRAWIRRGQIFQLTADRGRPVACPDDVRDHLALPRGSDDRQELAMDVVAAALVFFREHVLLPGRWVPEGGASLTTFFTGTCLTVRVIQNLSFDLITDLLRLDQVRRVI
jgi:hypothetical protein